MIADTSQDLDSTSFHTTRIYFGKIGCIDRRLRGNDSMLTPLHLFLAGNNRLSHVHFAALRGGRKIR